MTRLEALIARREELALRSAAQRERLTRDWKAVEDRLWPVAAGYAFARWLRSAPVAVGLGVAVLAVAGPRRTVRWLSAGLTALSFARRISALLRGH